VLRILAQVGMLSKVKMYWFRLIIFGPAFQSRKAGIGVFFLQFKKLRLYKEARNRGNQEIPGFLIKKGPIHYYLDGPCATLSPAKA
jgi:hypothetical protein